MQYNGIFGHHDCHIYATFVVHTVAAKPIQPCYLTKHVSLIPRSDLPKGYSSFLSSARQTSTTTLPSLLLGRIIFDLGPSLAAVYRDSTDRGAITRQDSHHDFRRRYVPPSRTFILMLISILRPSLL